MAKSVSEIKGSLRHMLARKRTRSWGIQSEPPAAGLEGKYKCAHCPGADGALLKM